MSEDKIEQLIKECLAQKRSAQKELYKTFYAFAMSICLRYSNNRYEAAELINEGFMKVFSSLNRYNNEYPFKAWLGKIMRNTSIDYYRRQLKNSIMDDLDTADQAETEAAIESKLNYKDLLGLVQQLSIGYRTVFNLYAIDGYSHEEISKILNISIGTSKSNLFKARMKLRDMVAKTNLSDRAIG